MVRSRHHIRTNIGIENSEWRFGIFKSTIQVISTMGGCEFYLASVEQRKAVNKVLHLRASPASEIVSGLTMLAVSPLFTNYCFLNAFLLYFVLLYSEIVHSIYPVAESCQHTFLNEWINLCFLSKSDNILKHPILCHFVEWGIINHFLLLLEKHLDGKNHWSIWLFQKDKNTTGIVHLFRRCFWNWVLHLCDKVLHPGEWNTIWKYIL